ncbi:MAG: ribosome maturation factor RimM [Clostridiales Family XIII bacterium]|jgi:16S rRNA processing protein RimM|nr:ribosome maturation factor RimM [Clostridiales Family XIII bacterium]
MSLIAVGKIVTAAGLRGEVKVYPYSGNFERYQESVAVFVGKETRRFKLIRRVKGMAVVALDGVVTREQAEALRGVEIFIDESDLPELPEDAFYVRDLVGCRVTDEEGAEIGTLSGVIQNTAQDLYEISAPDGKTVLLPAVADFVVSVDVAGKSVVARPPKGLLEL